MKFLLPLWKTFTNDKLLQKIIKNTGYLLSSNVASMGLSMLQSILAARLLGVAGFGVIATITAFASTLNRLFSFRMNELVVKYFGEAVLQQKRERAAAVVKAALLGETISAVLSFLVILLLAPLAAEKLADDAATTRLFILYGTMILANFATETSMGILQVRNKFKNQAFVNLVSSVLTASIIAWAFFAKKGLMEVMAAYLAGKFVLGLGTAALGWREMQKELGSGWLRTSFDHLPPFKELFGFAFSTNISSTIIMLVRDNEALWIAWFLSPVEVGYAKTALAIINLVQIPITPFISTTYPEINAAVTKERLDAAAQAFEAHHLDFRRLDRHHCHRACAFRALAAGFLRRRFPACLYSHATLPGGLGLCQHLLLEPPAAAFAGTADGAISHQPVVRDW